MSDDRKERNAEAPLDMLSGVPETMLQTVYARAKESLGRGAIRDAKAEEIIGGLNYDFRLRTRIPPCTTA